MASHDNATSENPGSEKESTRPSSMGLKRKAADIFDDKQVWVLPDNPIRQMAESGTLTIRHSTLKDCVLRAAGRCPTVAKDVATARLSLTAVKTLVKELKTKKMHLSVLERTDLMILERKTKMSEAFSNGYSGQKLKVAPDIIRRRQEYKERREGDQPYSECWVQEREKAMETYIASLEEDECFNYRDWKGYERDVRRAFENDKAEKTLPQMVKAAYAKGQDCRNKRIKLARSQNEANGNDAAKFEEIERCKSPSEVSRNGKNEVENESGPIHVVKEAPTRDDNRKHSCDVGESVNPKEVVQANPGSPMHDTDKPREGTVNSTSKCDGPGTVLPDFNASKKVPADPEPKPFPAKTLADDEDPLPVSDDDYVNLVNDASRSWSQELRQVIKNAPKVRKPEENIRSIRPSTALRNYHTELKKPFDMLERMKEVNRIKDPEIQNRTMEHPKLMPEPPMIGHEITAKFLIDRLYTTAKPLLRFPSKLSKQHSRRPTDRQAFRAFKCTRVRSKRRERFEREVSTASQ